MGPTAKVGRNRKIAVPKKVRKAVGGSAGDEPFIEVEKTRIVMKPKPRGYARHMLGLHKNIWKGVKVEEYVDKERKAW